MADFTEDKIVTEEIILDFSEEERNEFIEKFKTISFECIYSTVNELQVTTDYHEYFITVHKKDGKYYVIVYRPDTFDHTYVHSKNCQRALFAIQKSYVSVDDVVENIKDIKSIIINNSIVVKDICEDFNQLNASLYTLSCKDVSTEEFLDDLRLISTDILTLYKKIGQKYVSHSHRTFD